MIFEICWSTTSLIGNVWLSDLVIDRVFSAHCSLSRILMPPRRDTLPVKFLDGLLPLVSLLP